MDPLKKKLYYVFVVNGFIRIYLEILLDGILYVFVNIRALMFVNFVDAFSYFFLVVFACFAIFATVFFCFYTKKVDIQKWSEKTKELLSETNATHKGVLSYHLIFIIRRVILAINAILLGSLNPNVHISIHAVSQLIVVCLITTIPMYESRFQKVSNLVMEVGIVIVFFSAFIFQNQSNTGAVEGIVIGVIFLSQFIIMMLTLFKGIKDMLLKYQNRKKRLGIDPHTVMTEKAVARHILDKSHSEYLQTKTPVLKTIDEDPELGFDKKMPVEEAKFGDVSPMRYISEFEEMDKERDLNSRIQQVHKKIFESSKFSPVGKKSKLNKLLRNMKKKKLKKKNTEQESRKDDVSQITKDLTSKPSMTNMDLRSKSNIRDSIQGSNDDGVSDSSPSKHPADTSDINDEMRVSKISLFSHNFQPHDLQDPRKPYDDSSPESGNESASKSSNEKHLSKSSEDKSRNKNSGSNQRSSEENLPSSG